MAANANMFFNHPLFQGLEAFSGFGFPPQASAGHCPRQQRQFGCNPGPSTSRCHQQQQRSEQAAAAAGHPFASFMENLAEAVDEGLVEFAMHLSKKEHEAKHGKRTPENYLINLAVGADVKPEEVSMKLKNGVLTVEVKHEQTSEDSRSYREYSKKYNIPEDVDLTKMESVLTPCGVLKIQAPFKPKPEEAADQAGTSADEQAAASGPAKRQPVEIPIAVVEDDGQVD